MNTSANVLIWVTCRNYEKYLWDAAVSAVMQNCPGVATFVSHDSCDSADAPLGVAGNRNRGTAYAKSHNFAYIIFLDADDILPQNYVARLLATAAGDECVVACGARCFGESTDEIRVKSPVTLPSLLELNTVHVSALVSVSLAATHQFNPKLEAYEDWDVWCRMAASGAKFKVCEETVLLIRRHSASRHSRKKVTFGDMQKKLRLEHQGKVVAA